MSKEAEKYLKDNNCHDAIFPFSYNTVDMKVSELMQGFSDQQNKGLRDNINSLVIFCKSLNKDNPIKKEVPIWLIQRIQNLKP